ncbi:MULTISPECIES: HNH endonuclease [Spirulina sp. CCY15215]|uniref:HNH endonuclease n=1 Tax=Spirulina sp. CCY15215 TaxID=2767591 RepID=UPI0032AF1B73
MITVTETLSQSVVVFSKNYLPLSRINIRRAIALLVTGKAEPVDFFSDKFWEIRSPSVKFQVPEHIRLTMTQTERVWKIPAVNRREVLRRDKNTCQYCGSKHKLTLDHVIPRSKGGKHVWDNVVIACEGCNSKKGARTPREAGMPLFQKPKAPMHPTVAFAEQFWRDNSWQ